MASARGACLMAERTARYAMARTVDLRFEDADRRVREELQKEGFGVLTEIDVSATLKAKQIGRASCRERVWRRAGGARMTTTKTRCARSSAQRRVRTTD